MQKLSSLTIMIICCSLLYAGYINAAEPLNEREQEELHAIQQLSAREQEDLRSRLTLLRACRQHPTLNQLGPHVHQQIAELVRIRYLNVIVHNNSHYMLRIRISRILRPEQFELLNDFALHGARHYAVNYHHQQILTLPLEPLRVSLHEPPSMEGEAGDYYGSAEIQKDQLENLQRIELHGDRIIMSYADGRELTVPLQIKPWTHRFHRP